MTKERINYLKIIKENDFFDLDKKIEEQNILKTKLKSSLLLILYISAVFIFIEPIVFLFLVFTLPFIYFYIAIKKDFYKPTIFKQKNFILKLIEILTYQPTLDFVYRKDLKEYLRNEKSKHFKPLKKSDLEYSLKYANHSKDESDFLAYKKLKVFYEEYSEENRLKIFDDKIQKEAKSMSFSLKNKVKSLIVNN